MTELEAIALYFAVPLEKASEIYVDDIEDADYEEILKLMREDDGECKRTSRPY